MGFSIINHPAIGVPPWLGKAPSLRKRESASPSHQIPLKFVHKGMDAGSQQVLIQGDRTLGLWGGNFMEKIMENPGK